MDHDQAGIRTLMVLNADFSSSQHVEGGRRADFHMLRDELDADVVDLKTVEAAAYSRAVRRFFGPYVALAVCARVRAVNYDVIWCDNENEALILGLLLSGSRIHTPLVTIAVYPGKPQKRFLFTRLRAHRRTATWLAQGSDQARVLVESLGVSKDRVQEMPFAVDTEFWDPRRSTPAVGPRPYVFAAGRQHRDYATLVAACTGLDVDLRVSTTSLWSTSSDQLAAQELPPWISVGRYSYPGLRDQYAGAAVVVVPTVAADFPAGVTSALEGMSMARPVIVSGTPGNIDTVADRDGLARIDPELGARGTYAEKFLPHLPELHQQTGYYVPVGDVEAVRHAIEEVLARPEDAARIGTAARKVATELHDVSGYVERSVTAVRAAATRSRGRR